jgi:hypothetical protein
MADFWRTSYLLSWNIWEAGISNIAAIFSKYFFSFFIDFTQVLLLNSLAFLILFFGGMAILKTNGNKLFFVLTAVFLLSLVLYFLRFYPLFCIINGRTSTENFVIVRTSLYLLPLALIPVAIFIEKIMISLKSNIITITIYVAIIIFVTLQNIQRIERGISFYEISNFINKIEEIPDENKIVIIFALDEPAYLYYKNRITNNLGDVYILLDGFVDISSMPQTKLQRYIVTDFINLTEKEFAIFILNTKVVKTEDFRSNVYNLAKEKYANEYVIFQTKSSTMFVLRNSPDNQRNKVLLRFFSEKND